LSLHYFDVAADRLGIPGDVRTVGDRYRVSRATGPGPAPSPGELQPIARSFIDKIADMLGPPATFALPTPKPMPK
jgi:hypothetical protein